MTTRIIERKWDGRGFWRSVEDLENRQNWAVVFEAAYMSERCNCELLNRVCPRQVWFFPGQIGKIEMINRMQQRGLQEQMAIIIVYKYWEPMSEEVIVSLEMINSGLGKIDKGKPFDPQFETLLGKVNTGLKKRYCA